MLAVKKEEKNGEREREKIFLATQHVKEEFLAKKITK